MSAKSVLLFRKEICLFLTLVLCVLLVAPVWDTGSVSAATLPDSATVVCTDGLGRTISTSAQTGTKKKDKFVGLFYWTWHAGHSKKPAGDVTQILSKHPGIERDWFSGWWGSTGAYFWDEPLFGYYDGLDPWVYRKHAELLAEADVDVIIFDCTNGTELFLNALDVLAKAFTEARAAGADTPQFAFMLPFWSKENNATDLRMLWEKIYSVGKYKDLWFYWKGKPLVLGLDGGLNTGNATEYKIKNFFTFRSVQDSYFEGQEENAQWGWLAKYPQTVYKVDGRKEEISVGTAQNYSDERGLTAMNAGNTVHGRTWSTTKGGRDTSKNAVLYGANFAEQFEYAIKQDPEFIFITGWNEWVAGRFTEWEGINNAFPDEFNAEYSRDIEPSAGILKDHYYYQMVDYIRKFKGTDAPTAVNAKKTIDIKGDAAQWNSGTASYKAYAGNTKARDGKGYNRRSYKNTTGRNDIVGAKFAYDDQYVYFYAETASDLTAASGKAWMRLFIDVAGSKAPNWEGYEFVVNRVAPASDGAVLEKCKGDWQWESASKVAYSVSGKVLQIRIPRSALGIADGPFTLNFKWADNGQKDGDVMDFYSSGDVAPLGRFNYSYTSTQKVLPVASLAPAAASETPENGGNKTETVLPELSPKTPEPANDSGAGLPLEAIIAIAAAVLILLAVLVILIVRKEKRKKA